MGRRSFSTMMCVLLAFVGSPGLADYVADYVAEVTADNPASWWRFEDSSSAEGATASDSAGNFDGAYNGDTQLLAGIVGQSAWFDGYLDYVAIGSMGALPVQGSIELWLLADAVQNYRNVFTTGPLGELSTGNAAIRFEEHASGDLWLAIGDDNGGLPNFVTGLTHNLTAGKWHHVVVTWDTALGVVNGYLNGVRVVVDEPNTFWPAQLSDVKIGIGYALWGERSWLGRADEVAIYEHQLGQARVQAHFDAAILIFADSFESGNTSGAD